ncbi:MAG: ABC transporter permease, partial [Bacteroidota bacterium]
MWLNYLKIAFRNLLKNKAFAGINILGLAMGLACCLLIVTYILDAVSYDSHHKDGDHIYRVGTEFTFGENATKTGSTPSPLARAIKEDFPEVLESARLVQAPQVEKYLIRYEEEAFYETSGMHVDSTYFQVLTYRFLEGDAKHCLDAPFQAVISDEMSRKLFG